MHLRGRAATSRALVALAVTAAVVWMLAGEAPAWWEPSANTGPALAAAAANPISLTADRGDVSPPLSSLATRSGQSTRSAPRPTDAPTRDQPPGPPPRHPPARGPRRWGGGQLHAAHVRGGYAPASRCCCPAWCRPSYPVRCSRLTAPGTWTTWEAGTPAAASEPWWHPLTRRGTSVRTSMSNGSTA